MVEVPMKPLVLVFVALFLAAPLSEAHAQKSAFCRGFSEGWKTAKGELALVPLCPLEPITPIGSTPYREGIKAGLRSAQRRGGGNTGGPISRIDQRGFCRGFAVGWKTVKGNLSLVPLCPIAPITPLGSTPYREGLKAGMEKAKKP
jgi:hypothetical protein